MRIYTSLAIWCVGLGVENVYIARKNDKRKTTTEIHTILWHL